MGVRNFQKYFTSDQKCIRINSFLKAIYIMKHTWISRSESCMNIGSNVALFPKFTLKKSLLKNKKYTSLTYSIINIIIKSWCRILKARCILLRNFPTEVTPWEFNYRVLELRLGLRWRLLILIFVKPFMLWRHQFEISKHVKTSQEFNLSHPATVQHQCMDVRMLVQWSDYGQEYTIYVTPGLAVSLLLHNWPLYL